MNSSSCCDEETVFFVGNTGAGKSTTINYLAGRKIVTVRDADKDYITRLEVENPLDGCTIGHDAKSETKYLRGFIDASSSPNLVLYDTPGFEDTEGGEVDIANSVAIAWAIRQSKTVRIVLVIDAYCILAPKGNELSKLFKLVKRFLVNMEDTIESVSSFAHLYSNIF